MLLNTIGTEVFRKYLPVNKTNTPWFCYLNADNKTILINKKSMRKKIMMAALVTIAVNLIWGGQPAKACTRAVYIGPDNMVITGRTMDWKEDIQSNLYLFPRGIKRAGYDKGNTVEWTSKYCGYRV